jgi:hypothetical protein
VRNRYLVCVWLILVGVIASAAQSGGNQGAPGEEFIGTWAGTWEGAGSGTFELTIDKGKHGDLTGSISVTGEGAYKAAFKTLSFDGKKMNATYDFPPNEAIEVALSGSFDGKNATGTWSAREKGAAEVAAGSWTVASR